ncbi:MAG: hypothetical protein D6722_01930 [Bacteroidetes bacterium]|nr:MAG: hypothetical protein D6722_01930 [Bacteroidota bacterium]
MPYKPHYACFGCRKAFKRRRWADIFGDTKGESLPARCPDCGQPMADMGLDFEAPKRSDRKAWAHLASLYASGITFHSCGCSGPGFIPRDQAEHVAFLQEKLVQYVEQKRYWLTLGSDGTEQDPVARMQVPRELVRGTRKRPEVDPAEAVAYWAGRIAAVEARFGTLEG